MSDQTRRSPATLAALMAETPDLVESGIDMTDYGLVDYGSNFQNIDLTQGGIDVEFSQSMLDLLLESDAQRADLKKTAGTVKKLTGSLGKKGTSKVAGVAGKTLGAVDSFDSLLSSEEAQAKDAVALGRDVSQGGSDVVNMLTKSADGLDEVIDADDIARITRNKKWADRLGNNGKALSGVYNGLNLYEAVQEGDTDSALKSGAGMTSDLAGLGGTLLKSKALNKVAGGLGAIPSLINLSNATDAGEIAYHSINSAGSMLTAAGTMAGSAAITGAGGVIGAGLAGWEAGNLIRAAADSDHAKAFYDDGVTMSDAAVDSAVATNMAFDKAGDSAQSWLTDHGMENVGSFANSVIDGTGFAAGAAQTIATAVPTAIMDAGAAAWNWAFGDDKDEKKE